MTTNPFNPQAQTPVVEPNHNWQYKTEFSDEGMTTNNDNPSGMEINPSHPARRFINGVCVASALFLIMVFSVFREIQHNRELYRMSRMVATSEAQMRQWQERFRLEEAREAGFQAVLQSQSFSTSNPQIAEVNYPLPNRRR
jgi:hypothetical protein